MHAIALKKTSVGFEEFFVYELYLKSGDFFLEGRGSSVL